MPAHARCTTCGRPAEPIEHRCACGGRIAFEYAYDDLRGWTPAGTGLGRYFKLESLNPKRVPPGAVAVCLVTGTGFKAPGGFEATGAPPTLDLADLDRLGSLAAERLRDG